MKKSMKRLYERIRVDRKIVEALGTGKSINWIKKEYKVGKERIREVRDLGLSYDYLKLISAEPIQFGWGSKALPPVPEIIFPLKPDGRRERVSDTDVLLDPHRDWIKERLVAKWHAQSIFEDLPVQVPRANFYRYLSRNNLWINNQISKNVLEIIHKPGECLQIDWGKLCTITDATGKKKNVWVFIGVLGYSRYEMVRVVLSGDHGTTLTAIESMLGELGGVPEKVTSDNPRVFVDKADKYEPDINMLFERFASHYGFIIEALPPRSPELKGKVERQVQYVRRLFESYDLSQFTIESAQAHIDRKLVIANERRHGTIFKKPIEVFVAEESLKLKPLPTLRYEREHIEMPLVRRDGFVRFANKYYRIDSRLQGQKVMAIGNQTHISIYHEGRLLEVYEKITDPHISKACKDHYRESWEKTLQNNGHYLEQAKKTGPYLVQMIEKILKMEQGFIDTRKVWGLLTLDKTYNKSDIDDVCRLCLECGDTGYRPVLQLLKLRMKKAKSSDQLSFENFEVPRVGKFTRSISEYKRHLYLVHTDQVQQKGVRNECGNN